MNVGILNVNPALNSVTCLCTCKAFPDLPRQPYRIRVYFNTEGTITGETVMHPHTKVYTSNHDLSLWHYDRIYPEARKALERAHQLGKVQ